jgi:hypothetical protein
MFNGESAIRAFKEGGRSENQHDPIIFKTVAEQLFARCRVLSQELREITLVFANLSVRGW